MDNDSALSPPPTGSRSRSASLCSVESNSSADSSSSSGPSPAPSPSSRRERGRERSRSRGGNGEEGESGGRSKSLQRSSSGRSSRRQRQPGGLSQKTLSIVNTLPQPPRAGAPEEDEEERRLALEEKERRQQQQRVGAPISAATAPSSSSVRAGATASASAGTGSPKASGTEYTDYMSVRILLLGDSGVGKTSLMMRYSEDQFAPCLLSTAGVDFKVRHLKLEESRRRVKVQIWDTAGQERMHVITRTYYKGSHGIALVYNLADPDSFRNVNYWMANIQQHAGDKVVKVLIGNKSDLPDRAIASDEGAAVAKEYGFHHFYETSAKSGDHVQEAFDTLALDIVRKLEEAHAQGEAAAAATAAAAGQGGGKGLLGKAGRKADCVVS